MYEDETFDSILDRMLTRISDAIPEIDIREGSVVYNALAPAAVELQDVYIALDTVLKESFAITQSREYLILRCAERGIHVEPATHAIRKGEFTGKYNVNDLIGAAFSLNQLNYIVQNKRLFELECDMPGKEGNLDSGDLNPSIHIEGLETARLGKVLTSGTSSGKAIRLGEFTGSFDDADLLVAQLSSKKSKYRVIKSLSNVFMLECETAGKEGNFDNGELIPVEYIDGLDTAELTEVFTYGVDEEDTEALRKRYLANLNTRAFGGNIADYKEKVLAFSGSNPLYVNETVRNNGGVGAVKVIPACEEGGKVKIVIIDSYFQTTLSDSSLIDAVQAAIDDIAPIGHVVTVVSATEDMVNVFAPIRYGEGVNQTVVKGEVKEAVKKYFVELAKGWGEDEQKAMVITIGNIYTCIKAVKGVDEVDILNIKLNGKTGDVEINPYSIPKLGGLDDGKEI